MPRAVLVMAQIEDVLPACVTLLSAFPIRSWLSQIARQTCIFLPCHIASNLPYLQTTLQSHSGRT